MSDAIRHYINEFRSRRDVDPYQAEALFDIILAEEDVDLLVDLLSAWSAKGATQDEIYRFARVLRSRMKKIDVRGRTCVDIVGTGGSLAKTFNVSTAAAFVVAGAGVPVAKHNNRAATSSSGSADALSLLGVRPDAGPELAQRSLDEAGICFMFAPKFHALSSALAIARKRVAGPTIFNCLGPLCNPAGVGHQVIGVWDQHLVATMARVLALLGTTRSWVVNGYDRLDEISLTGHSTIAEVTPDGVSSSQVEADDLGIGPFAGDLPHNCTAAESAKVIARILDNELKDTDAEKLVLINSAAAVFIAGGSETRHDAYARALESIRSGAAAGKLALLREVTK
jgi:anthranilate phosphoribosyltransferase